MSQEEHDDGAGDGHDVTEAEVVEIDDRDARLDRAEQEKADLRDKWLRAVAELENYKKRVKREIDDATFRAQQNLLSAFLPTVDNLTRAQELAKGNDQLLKGMEMVVSGFMSALQRYGVEPVPSVGQAFDPAIHEALQQIDSPDHAPGTVIREWEKGYRQGDKLLRPARVVIAGPGSGGGKNDAAS
jgi:molecular chaperone GrpE